MAAKGQVATSDEKPHHYAYFKVENNLGEGGHSFNFQTKTCLGTFVMQIMLCKKENEQWILAPINPSTHPQEYQLAMEQTLKELIKVERQLLFYRNSSELKGPSYSLPGSAEGKEWSRLNQLKVLFSGIRHLERVNYKARTIVEPSIARNCSVENELAYMQEGGSCPIFSVKSFVSSVLGQELTSLHTHFMQQYKAMDYVRDLKQGICSSNKEIKQQNGASKNTSSNQNHFFQVLPSIAQLDSQEPHIGKSTCLK